MIHEIQRILQANHIFSYDRNKVTVASLENEERAVSITKEILYTVVDPKTALYLSGGRTPKTLYEALAREEKLAPGVVGLIDERYGEPLHEGSNERMIANTGLMRYLTLLNFPYYTILRGLPIAETAQRYDELFRSLGSVYRNSVGILGIGADGHTAGIAGNRSDFKNPLFHEEVTVSYVSYDGLSSDIPEGTSDRSNPDEDRTLEHDPYAMVGWFNDEKGPFKERITMTFLGLSMLDLYIVLVLGAEKKGALERMFEKGSEEEIPARFYIRPEIAPKTVIITDQQL